MEAAYNIRGWLDWLIKVRVIIITFLFGIGLAITRLTPTNIPVRYFVAVVLLWYTISVVHVWLLAIWRDYQMQARVQVLSDLLLATAIVYITGGIDTYFNFLFPLLIIVASILLPRWWTYATAALSFICFGSVVELTYFGVIPTFQVSARGDLNSFQGVILINLFAYTAIAYLASTLVHKLRETDVELVEKSGALQSLQALHKDVIDSMRGGLITTDLQGQITLLNMTGQKLLGVSGPEVLGRRASELFMDVLPDVAFQGEVRAATPSGEIRVFGVTCAKISIPEGGEAGLVYTFDDRTEMRRLEREVRMRDRLAAVGRMAAGIAHEIRNPLAAIAGSVKVLEGISNLSDDQRALVNIVTNESERLNRIISDFLFYSRDKSYTFSQVNLCQLVDETLRLIENRPEVQTGGVRVERVYLPEEAYAEADADRLKQVLWNLCENAIRAMQNGGALSARVEPKGEAWQIVISDTGKGMSVQQLEKVFEPFQSGFNGGTGLGLAIVYQIVQAHQGKVWMKSEVEKGTEVHLELPVAQPAYAQFALKAVANG